MLQNQQFSIKHNSRYMQEKERKINFELEEYLEDFPRTSRLEVLKCIKLNTLS